MPWYGMPVCRGHQRRRQGEHDPVEVVALSVGQFEGELPVRRPSHSPYLAARVDVYLLLVQSRGKGLEDACIAARNVAEQFLLHAGAAGGVHSGDRRPDEHGGRFSVVLAELRPQ